MNDKGKVELWLGLQEQGDETTHFTIRGILLAIGYNRIVYGDHGPYIEFDKHHIKCKLVSKFGQELDFDNPPRNTDYYYWWLMIPEISDVKIYFQLRDVKDLPNAPTRDDGLPHSFNRKEGYADYKVGMYYVSPWQVTIV
jgi:hypothetical protein